MVTGIWKDKIPYSHCLAMKIRTRLKEAGILSNSPLSSPTLGNNPLLSPPPQNY